MITGTDAPLVCTRSMRLKMSYASEVKAMMAASGSHSRRRPGMVLRAVTMVWVASANCRARAR